MRATIVAALAGLAAAAPAVVVTDVVDVYTTVWDDGSSQPTETPSPPAGHYGGGGSWGQPAQAAPSPAWTPAAASPSPAASPAAGSYTGAGQATPSDYSSAVVAHHNAHRANHSAPDIAWDDNLASIAQQIGQSCVYAHDT